MTLPIWVIIYLAFTVLVGILASRLIRNSQDFISAGRSLPMFLNASALFAFWFGSETVLGASSEFINHGFLGVIEDPFGGFLCLILFATFFARKLYRLNLVTLGDLFRQVYGSKIERWSAFFMIIAFFGYVAAQIIALGILFHNVFGLDEFTGRIISAFIVTIYTAAGGMWSVSITDFIQSLMIIGGLIVITIFLSGQVNFESLWIAPKPHFFDFTPNDQNDHNWIEYAAAWCALGLGSLASQDIFQRVNAAKSEKTAVRSTYFGAVLYLIFAMFPLLLGLFVYQIAPELTAGDTQHAIVQLIANHTPLWLQVLFYGALISAIFSTCSGSLLAPASLLAENLIKPIFLPHSTDQQFLRISRISVLIIAVISTVLASISDSIYELVSQSSILGMVSILVPMTASLYARKKQRPAGAYWSMSAGLLIYILTELIPSLQIIPSMFLALIASIGGLYFGNRMVANPNLSH